MRNNIVVLTGAGVSAESGLETYRDNGGLWDSYNPMEVASIDGWYRNRKTATDGMRVFLCGSFLIFV